MIKSDILDNGLCLLTESMPDVRSISLGVWLTRGSRDEGEGKENSGIAHFTEHMLFKGTARRGVGEIAGAVEGAGGQVNAWTSFDQTVYHIMLDCDQVAVGLDILSDMLRNSTFD